ncbi:MAG: biotin--[acetyl-CoA-carboxylase] ligase [Bacteroidales bacterium]
MEKRIVGKEILKFSSLDSTNDHCRKIAGTSAIDEGTVVWADKQLMGRGQGSNTWESESGQNLTFSIVLYPRFLEASDQFYLSMVASLGLTDFLKEFMKNIYIKWPNDIYAGDRKIAGILIENSVMENRIDNSILGIGININQDSFPKYIPNPVSLKQITGYRAEPGECLEKICRYTDHWYAMLQKEEKTKIKNRYTKHLYGLDQLNRYRKGETIFKAYIRGVDNFGRLALEDDKGETRYFGLKEVEFLQNK